MRRNWELLVLGFIIGVIATVLYGGRTRAQIDKQNNFLRETQNQADLDDISTQYKQKLSEIEAAMQKSGTTSQAPGPKHPLLDPSFMADFWDGKKILGSIQLHEKPEWQRNIDWSFGNRDAGGAVNCIWEYVGRNLYDCIVNGGRSCVMSHAKAAAAGGNPDYNKAFDLTLITQCHNGNAADTIRRAGSIAVTEYVKHHN